MAFEFYEVISFLRVGSFIGSLIHLVEGCPVGMIGEQLGDKLRYHCHSMLVQLYRCTQLEHRKLGCSHVTFWPIRPPKARRFPG